MAGKYGSPSVTVTYEDAPGGTGRNITSHILKLGGVKVESLTEMNMPFGASSEAHTPTGVTRTPDIPIEGNWDTTATTGPHVVFGAVDDGPQDATRTLVIVFGDSKTFTIETRLVEFEVIAEDGKLTGYKALIRQAAAGAWT